MFATYNIGLLFITGSYMKKTLLYISIILLLTQLQVHLTGCANIIPPSGGPRDSLPPRLVSAHPVVNTRFFKDKKIVLDFDEYVELDNIQENLLVTPTPRINPVVETKLRTVTIQLKDTLERNTTYTLDFGKALKDIHEGNVLKNFTYVFSTGAAIDSLQLSGNVIVAETGKTDSTLIAVLYTSRDDSAVVKDRPRYISRLDSTGHFTFKRLPPGTFSLYAFKDEGGSRRYLSSKQLFAFASERVTTGENPPPPVTLLAYLEKDTSTPAKKPAAPAHGRAGSKTANPQQDKRLKLETNLQGSELDLLGDLIVSSKTGPFQTLDTTKLLLTDDSARPITSYHVVEDTSRTKFTVQYKWPQNTGFRLIVDKDFAQDTTGRKLSKNDTIVFRTKKETEYGMVRLRFLNLHLERHPVLQFAQGDQVKFSYPLNTGEFYARLFTPGEYDLRILYDENNNGIWDPGEFFGKHRQPEKVYAVPRKLTVKANWDNEVDITL